MFRFRLFIFKDPEAGVRGYSLAGIKIPLTTFCPIQATQDTLGYDDRPIFGRHAEYWSVPTCLIVLAKPDLRKHFRHIETLLIPTDWCDVAPIASYNDLNRMI